MEQDLSRIPYDATGDRWHGCRRCVSSGLVRVYRRAAQDWLAALGTPDKSGEGTENEGSDCGGGHVPGWMGEMGGAEGRCVNSSDRREEDEGIVDGN